MMPRIATVIPQLLQKGELNAAINKLSVDDEKTGLDDTEGASADILKVDGKRVNRGKYNKFNKKDDKEKGGEEFEIVVELNRKIQELRNCVKRIPPPKKMEFNFDFLKVKHKSKCKSTPIPESNLEKDLFFSVYFL